MSAYTRILVPFDGTELSHTALEAGIATAAWNQAELVLLYVEREGVDLEEGTNQDLDAIERDAEALLRFATPALTRFGIPVENVSCDVRAGDVVAAITEVVEERLCDLIVMGTHGPKGLLESLTGSTTDRVLRTTPASMFIVRPKGYPYLRD